jgi:hypothetical protein
LKYFRYAILILAALLTVFILFDIAPNDSNLNFQFSTFDVFRVKIVSGFYEDSIFSSRIISYILIFLFYFSLSKETRNNNDKLLLVMACVGFITESYNVINIYFIHGWTSVFHWDILLVFLICARIVQLRKRTA